MGLTLAKCPACGAELNLETDKDYFYCPYCGSKVAKQADKIVIETVTRHVEEHITRTESSKDEVRMKRVELFDKIFNPSPEVLERRRQKAEEREKQDTITMLLIGAVLIVFCSIAVFALPTTGFISSFRPLVYVALFLGVLALILGLASYLSKKK